LRDPVRPYHLLIGQPLSSNSVVGKGFTEIASSAGSISGLFQKKMKKLKKMKEIEESLVRRPPLKERARSGDSDDEVRNRRIERGREIEEAKSALSGMEPYSPPPPPPETDDDDDDDDDDVDDDDDDDDEVDEVDEVDAEGDTDPDVPEALRVKM